MSRNVRRIVGAVIGVVAIAATVGVSAQYVSARKMATYKPPHATAQRPITQLIVKYKGETATSQMASGAASRMAKLGGAAGLALTYKRPMGGLAHVLYLPQAMTVAEAKAVAAKLAQNANVEYAEPDYVMRALVTVPPNDPGYAWNGTIYTGFYFQSSDKTKTGVQGQWNLMAPTGSYSYTPLGGSSTSMIPVGGANLPSAWGITPTTTGIVVGVVDTGVTSHLDLNANLVNGSPAYSGYDFISENAYEGSTDPNASNPYFTANDGDGRDSDPSDPGDWTTAGQCGDGDPTSAENSSWHGTHVSGIIGAVTNNGIGVAGITYNNAQILMARALGRCGGSMSDITDAMRWAAGLSGVTGASGAALTNQHPAKVINLSLGGSTASGTDTCGQTELSAVTAIRAAGVVIVAATGNDGAKYIASPASCPGVIAVTAHTIEGDSSDYANVGNSGDGSSTTAPSNWTTISAPGGGCGTVITSSSSTACADQYVWSTINAGTTTPLTTGNYYTYGGYAGTSMATPHVTAAVAMIRAVQSGGTPDYVRLVLQNTARAFPTGTYCQTLSGYGNCGAGMLDVYQAVSLAQSGAPAVFAGLAQVVAPGATVTLNGEAASPTSATMAYTWTVTNGTATLSSATALTPTFTAPASGSTTFQLTANDGLHSTSSTTTVYVDHAPVVSVPATTINVTTGAAATFTATATDADGDAVSFVLDSGPSSATMSSAGVFTWSSATPAGTYQAVFHATDGAMDSASTTVNIVVTDASSGGSSGGGSSGGGSSSSGSSGGGGGAIGLLGLALLALGAFGLRRNRALH